MERIEVNLLTGQVSIITMSPEEIAAIPPAPEPPALTKIYKSNIWRACTDSEAETLDALLRSQSVKLQRLWADVEFILTTDPLYTMIHAACAAALSPARADEILAPTE